LNVIIVVIWILVVFFKAVDRQTLCDFRVRIGAICDWKPDAFSFFQKAASASSAA
jgi:hypothetical protein